MKKFYETPVMHNLIKAYFIKGIERETLHGGIMLLPEGMDFSIKISI